MKSFNIKPTEKTLSWGTLMCLSLGESGRGRVQTLVPCHKSAIADGEAVETAMSKDGKPKIVASQQKGSLWLARVSAQGGYSRGTYGSVFCPQSHSDSIRVVAMGCGAYGDAGNIGDWMDFLLEVQDGSLLRVRESGTANGKGEAYWLHFTASKVVRVEVGQLMLYFESVGLEPPQKGFDDDMLDLKTKA